MENKLLTLRSYQERSFDRIRELIRQGNKRILLVAPTGSGKTVTSSHLLAGAHAKGNESMFMAHRREIIYQTGEKLNLAGIDFNLILAGHKPSMMSSVYLASKDTLIRRRMPEKIVLLVIDEAHHAVANTYKKVINQYPDAVVIGLTATPCRGDGRGLGDIFDEMVVAATVPELIDLGHLVPVTIFNAEVPSPRGLNIKQFDYDMESASALLNNPKLVGDIVDNWCVHAAGMRTIVFATDIAHSLYIERYFCESGIEARHIDGETPTAQRTELLEAHRAGEFPVLCNVGIATEGYDDPNIQAVVIARPTRSFGLYLQMAGRGLRPAIDPAVHKPSLILLDHADCWREHGSPTEPVVWTLDPEGPAVMAAEPKAKGSTVRTSWLCEACRFINDHGRYCQACGLQRATSARTPEFAPGMLTEVSNAKGRVHKTDKEKFWNKCLWICINKKLKVGAASHMYKKQFGVWPRGFNEMPKGAGEWAMTADKFHTTYLGRVAKRSA